MRIGAFAFLRLIVMLRRIWVSLDSISSTQKELLDLEQRRLSLEHPTWTSVGSAPKKAVISKVEVEDLNKNWRMRHP